MAATLNRSTKKRGGEGRERQNVSKMIPSLVCFVTLKRNRPEHNEKETVHFFFFFFVR